MNTTNENNKEAIHDLPLPVTDRCMHAQAAQVYRSPVCGGGVRCARVGRPRICTREASLAT
eukprot:11191761-Lingulodinium_polyedra.AAC.1